MGLYTKTHHRCAVLLTALFYQTETVQPGERSCGSVQWCECSNVWYRAVGTCVSWRIETQFWILRSVTWFLNKAFFCGYLHYSKMVLGIHLSTEYLALDSCLPKLHCFIVTCSSHCQCSQSSCAGNFWTRWCPADWVCSLSIYFLKHIKTTLVSATGFCHISSSAVTAKSQGSSAHAKSYPNFK